MERCLIGLGYLLNVICRVSSICSEECMRTFLSALVLRLQIAVGVEADVWHRTLLRKFSFPVRA